MPKRITLDQVNALGRAMITAIENAPASRRTAVAEAWDREWLNALGQFMQQEALDEQEHQGMLHDKQWFNTFKRDLAKAMKDLSPDECECFVAELQNELHMMEALILQAQQAHRLRRSRRPVRKA